MEFEICKVSVHDTGIGREAGYKDDAELIAAAEAGRQELEDEAREILEAVDAELERRFLFGA